MKTLFVVLSLAIFLFLQIVVGDRMAVGPFRADFLVLMVAYFGLHRGAERGAMLGFAVGFLQDLSNPAFLGLNALVKSVLGFTVGKVGKQTFPDRGIVMFFVLFAAALGHDLIYAAVFFWPHVGSLFADFFTAALPSALYTAAWGSLLHRVFMTVDGKMVSADGKKGQ